MDATLIAKFQDELDDDLLVLAIRVTSELLAREVITPRTTKNTIVTSSGGLSVTVIELDTDKVYQIFTNACSYGRVKAFCQTLRTLKDPRSKYFTPCHNCYDDIRTVSMKKIRPLNTLTDDLSQRQPIIDHVGKNYRKIVTDIGQALQFLNSIPYPDTFL